MHPPGYLVRELPMPLDITIEYDVECGYEDAALALARRLFARFDEAIDSLALVPTEEEDLALYLNGQLVRSQRRSGEAPKVADVLAALGDELAAVDRRRAERMGGREQP
jgi:predicted Rdx family selenoprotein